MSLNLDELDLDKLDLCPLPRFTLLQRNKATMQSRLREWMHAVVTAVEGANQSSVGALHRRFGDARAHPEIQASFHGDGAEAD